GAAISELRVDGGATANNLLLQFQADILQARVVRPRITETTALGAAYLAGLAVGLWKSVADIQNQWQVDRMFEPDAGYDAVTAVNNWRNAVETAKRYKP